MPANDDLLGPNAYATSVPKGGLPLPPARKVAVLACMDSRFDPAKVFGFADGDAHVIRNAGGVATDDAIRSIMISQRVLGTETILLLHHTNCGQETYTDDEMKDEVQAETGIRPPFAMEAFPDAEEDVRQTRARLQASPFIPNKDDIRGFIFEVETGKLREVV
ncbi:MAG: carbonic anhydrase [Actinomycetota bacterium]|nr:carbonic anhydrase [Acidimicrobiia bacterium]MDQ3293914.1 carbonic anhydrase [Actinomycetota bacterium]